MKYRLIEEKDIESLLDVRAATRENAISREDLCNLGVTRESVADMLRTSHRGWLCEENGRIVGFAIGDGKTGEMWVIALQPEFEGRGIGARLLAAVEEWLWSKGWEEIWLWTSSDPRKRAYGFYQRQGWFVAETQDEVVYLRKRKTGPME